MATAFVHVDKYLATLDDNEPTFSCPFCGMDGLTELGLWHHQPLYHISDPPDQNNMITNTCPICKKADPPGNMQVHIRNTHGLCDHRIACKSPSSHPS